MLFEKLRGITLDERVKISADSWGSVAGSITVSPPLVTKDIPHFEQWVNYNRFAADHSGLDLAAYRNTFGECVLGLPPRTPIHAIADGVVVSIEKTKVMEGVVDPYDHYLDTMVVAHGRSSTDSAKPSLIAVYAHATSTVKEGQYISQGQKIGRLYADTSHFSRGRLVHLHFGLRTYTDGNLQPEDPEILFPKLLRLTADPQRDVEFDLVERGERADVRLANYKTLLFGNQFMQRAREFSAPSPTYSLRRRLTELFVG